MAMKLSNEVKVSLVTAVCIMALAVISRKVISIQLDFVSLYGPVWVYIAYIISTDKTKTRSSPLFWSLAIIFATSAILILYAT